jgi:translation initiation factor 1A
MPKKKKSGKNSKNKKGSITAVKRVIEFKGDLQEYVVMTKMLGDRRITVKLTDGSEKMAIIPGRFRKRCWMKPGDILLASWREFQDNKLDIVHKYNSDEARQLARLEEIPSFFLDDVTGYTKTAEKDLGITFGAEDDFTFDDI